MKKIISCMAMLAVVAGCSQEAEAPAEPVEAVAEVPAVTMANYVGEWNVTLADGATHVTTNNADGTFTRTFADGATDGGIWTFTAEQSCWTPADGETACYTVGEADAAGMLTLTNVADGTVVTAAPVVPAAAETAAE